ncbi:uncharacterized protein [Panulirus ornatus]|uniref:uncharacterized protein isoform X2 n=1 Tax=Panulirus ornatus TaxID=150431 RepID=UPI003A89FA67
MRVWVAAAVWVGIVLVAWVEAQARDQRPLARTRQLSGNESHSDGASVSSDDDGNYGGFGSGDRSSGIGGISSQSSSGSRQFGGGRRQFGSGRARQYGRGRTRQYGGSGARQYGGGGARQHGGGGVRQHDGGGARQQSSGRSSVQPNGGSYSTVGDGDSNVTEGVSDLDVTHHQMDTTILLLQRISDRLAASETLQNQRAEIIDLINYRLTQIELQAEERKSVVNELSNALRHRMETTDNELERIVTFLDEIKTGITDINNRHTQLKAIVNKISRKKDSEEGQTTEPRLQAIMATLNGLHTSMQVARDDITQLGENLTALTNVTTHFEQMSQNMVTKQYLHQNLNEIKSQDSTPMSMLARMMIQPRTPRRGKSTLESEDCWKLMQQGKKRSGVYSIQPRYSPLPFFVYCDMETDGGGWTVIQRREEGSVDFLREWADYKHGFGNLAGEFWLGNEKIYLLTNQHVSTLRVDLADFDQQSAHALYSAFAIGSELEGYSLKMLGKYRGDAGDSLRYHVGRRFSTTDVDNDAWPEKSCARDHQGAWWYRACETSNLNGRYLQGPMPVDHQYTGVYWYDFRGPQYSLWKSIMMIRREGNVGEPIFKGFEDVQNTEVTPRSINENQQEITTSTSTARNFDPDHDPYVIYKSPYHSLVEMTPHKP